MALDHNGSHDFDALWQHTRDHEVRLLAFDLLELNGEEDRDWPLLERRRRRARLLRASRDPQLRRASYGRRHDDLRARLSARP